ncbi:MAG: MFS transporter [Clostridia bacterium]
MKESKTKKTNKVSRLVTNLVSSAKMNWKTPRPGEFLTLKEVTSYGLSQVGSFIYSTVIGLMVFGANYFCGAIMHINVMDFTKITILGQILGYALMWMNPFGVLIYENHGRLEPKTKIFAIISYAGQFLIGLACYFVPIETFESVPFVGMIALPQILGNILVVGAMGNFCTWIVRYKFCAKYGRIKPFVLLFGIPSAIFMSIIPFLPVQAAPYATKLIVLHFAFQFMSYFKDSYNVVGNMVTFMTPNSQERQRLYSIVPIITSLVPSVIGMFFPILIKLFGGYTNILTYKICVPIFSAAGVAVSFFVANCKERVIEKTDDSRPKVHFWTGAKKVLSNKYLWITNISNITSIWALAYGGILQWWFIYSIRMEWFVGIAANIVVLSMTLGFLMTPVLTRRFEKKTILIWSKFIAIVTILLMFLSIKINSIVLFMFAMFLRNGVSPIEEGIKSGMNADIMDYHQWRYGERADSMSGVFSWFLGPITMALSYVMPLLQQGAGFTSDWDILYNQTVIEKLFLIYIVLSIVSTFITIIPFFFFDLTRKKHDQCIDELQLRLKAENEEQERLTADLDNSVVADASETLSKDSELTNGFVSTDSAEAQSCDATNIVQDAAPPDIGEKIEQDIDIQSSLTSDEVQPSATQNDEKQQGGDKQ